MKHWQTKIYSHYLNVRSVALKESGGVGGVENEKLVEALLHPREGAT